MKSKLLFSILGVIAISAFTFGVTYAYYTASSETSFNGGVSGGLTSVLNLSSIYTATELVPLSDDNVVNAISKTSNKCVDKNGYEVCSLYRIILTNSSDSENLYGYVRTSSSSYTTDNLVYQIFDSSYNALTDIMTISNVTDTTVYFKKNTVNYSITSNGNVEFYLVIWLHDTGDFQNEDYSKTFAGYVGFESADFYGTGTGRVEANL